MKRIFTLLAFVIGIGTVSVTAQTAKKKTSTKNYKSKVKPTSTVGEKVHNVFSKNNKYSGVKVKGKNKRTNAKTKLEIKAKKGDH